MQEDEPSFGVWLRQRRRALDLTQEALAQRVGCARITIRRIEADELKPSQQLAELFAEHLGVPLAERKRWLQFARGIAQFPQPQVSDLPAMTLVPRVKPPTNLSAPLTSFLGRDHEIINGCRLVTTSRLLTLTGVGGAGKTRLALEMARSILDSSGTDNPNAKLASLSWKDLKFPDGIWWVELAPLSDGALIPETVAKVLGLREQPGQSLERLLAETLKTRQMLLLLDNCEHLAAACAQWVQQWLHESPHLHILATSREPLQLLGEQRFPVAPLAADSASELFVQRARLVDPTFTRTAANGAAIDQICQQVDYLPLAIELLAARSDLFSPQVMVERLQARPLDLVSAEMRDLPPRQRTLRHTIQHSYDLLIEREQALFRTLGVFVGGFDLAAVIHFGFDEPTFQALINKSLVQVAARHLSEDGERRFVLLETLREYAYEQLITVGEIALIRSRHAEYFLNLAAVAEQYMERQEKKLWLARLDRDHDNLRLALTCLIDTNAQAAQQMTRLLYGFWEGNGFLREGRQWVAKALAASTEPTLTRAWALWTAGALALEQGDYLDTQELAQESLTLFQAQEDLSGCAAAIADLGGALMYMGQNSQALDYFEQSLNLARQVDNRHCIAEALAALATVSIKLGKPTTQILAFLQESASIFRMLGELEGLAIGFKIEADAQMLAGDYTRAVTLCQQALLIHQQLGSQNERAWDLYYLGEATWLMGERGAACVYWKEALHFFENAAIRSGLMHGWYAFGQAERCLHQRIDQAIDYYCQSLKVCREMHAEELLVRCLIGLAAIALGRCRFDHATHLFGAVQRMIDNQSPFLVPLEREEYVQMIDAVRAHLEESIFAEAWIEGQAMTLDEAVAYALTVAYHGNLEKTSC